MTVSPFQPAQAVAPRPPRFDLFFSIHKAIRFGLCQLLLDAGATAFDDAAEVGALVGRIRAQLELCERHAEMEDRFIRPALAERTRGALEVFDTGHAHQRRIVQELAALLSALTEAAPTERSRVGRTLYLHLGTFLAESLTHMAEEERVIQPLLERHFTDDELRAIHAALIAACTPEERLLSASWMLRAASQPERLQLLGSMLGSAKGGTT